MLDESLEDSRGEERGRRKNTYLVAIYPEGCLETDTDQVECLDRDRLMLFGELQEETSPRVEEDARIYEDEEDVRIGIVCRDKDRFGQARDVCRDRRDNEYEDERMMMLVVVVM